MWGIPRRSASRVEVSAIGQRARVRARRLAAIEAPARVAFIAEREQPRAAAAAFGRAVEPADLVRERITGDVLSEDTLRRRTGGGPRMALDAGSGAAVHPAK
jgi:hypothetical protein